MNKKIISLNGKWEMSWCDVGAGSLNLLADMKHIPYNVPDDVHTPLIEAGIIPEPLYGMNSKECRWTEDKEFWCSRSFILDEDDMRSFMKLTFDGIDCTADIYLNGILVGNSNNAFVESEFDIKKHLQTGENILTVRIDQGLAEAKKHELEKMGEMWNNDQPYRVWMRKPQFVYGWDWTIWLATCGIWKDVYITAYDDAVISDVYIRTGDKNVSDGGECRLAVTVNADNFDEERYTLRCRIYDCENNIVSEEKISGGKTNLLTVPNAHLWWCNGMGEPYLYTAEILLLSDDENAVDKYVQKIGIRTVELSEPLLDNGEYGFTFVLNGEPVFCKGANHVPCDCLVGRITAEKERELISLAKEENMNMLRVWGGGVYSSEAFMTACDEMGIMVWHDFMFACGYYPDHNADFMRNVADEVHKAVRRLRRHTSLIGWSGNNEIQEMYRSQTQWIPDLPWYGKSIYEKLLPEITKELCPSLIYRETSPTGGSRAEGEGAKGDQHIWLLTHVHEHPHYLDLWRFTDFKVKFLSEFGIMGAMTYETAESCIPAENMQCDDPVWLYHTNFCQDNSLLDSMMKRYFGERKTDIRQYILHSQAIQAELSRHIYEEFRRQKFICSGLLFWTLSDSYGIHNWSIIDYKLRRKPVYYALKQAMVPVALCIKGWNVQNNEGNLSWREHWKNSSDIIEIWGMNDTLADENARLEWCLLSTSGEVICRDNIDVRLEKNSSAKLAEVSLKGVAFDPVKTVLRARLTVNGKTVNEAKYFFAPFSEMGASNANVKCESVQKDDENYELTLLSDSFVWLLHIEEPDGTKCSDNDFALWANEPKKVIVRANNMNYKPSVTRLES